MKWFRSKLILNYSQNKSLTHSEENNVYYIAGSTLNGVLKQKICDKCKQFAKTVIHPNEPHLPQHMFLNEYLDKGGLKWSTSGIYRICRETERFVQHHKDDWMKREDWITDMHIWIMWWTNVKTLRHQIATNKRKNNKILFNS